jgi:Raf kinase inhibitor-like YbhB/YbcL family protein
VHLSAPDHENGKGSNINDPFARLPVAPGFTVTSADVTDGQALLAQMSSTLGVPGGKDLSPQLSWSGAPAGTESYSVAMYDPDAPTGSGFWHWAVADIPASASELPARAGDGSGERLPVGVFHIPNDACLVRFIGGASPPGNGRHRHVIVVQAIDIGQVEKMGVQAGSTRAWLGYSIAADGHLLGRAVIAPRTEIRPRDTSHPEHLPPLTNRRNGSRVQRNRERG